MLHTFLGTLPRVLPYAVVEEDNSVIYSPEQYGDEILLDVIRRKGSTGKINVTWAITIHPNVPVSFIVSPQFGLLHFAEGQWNSSIRLIFSSIPVTIQDAVIFVKLLNVSGGAMLGNIRNLKIIFPFNDTDPSKVYRRDDINLIEILLPCLAGALLVFGLTALIIFIRKPRQR